APAGADPSAGCPPGRGDYQSLPRISPFAGDDTACQVTRLILLETKRTLASPISPLTPPECRLRAVKVMRLGFQLVVVPRQGAWGTDTHMPRRTSSETRLLGV